MMISGRITSNKGSYWKKVATFININDSERLSAMSSDINDSLTILNGLSEENRARVFAMVINMAFADGTVQENVATLLKHNFCLANSIYTEKNGCRKVQTYRRAICFIVELLLK